MVLIYGNETCPWCLKAKKLAEDFNLKYEWRDTDKQEFKSQLKAMMPTAKTIPQIWWNGIYLGGYENFAKELENTINAYGDGKL